MEKQMTIDDYLNNGDVEIIDCSAEPVYKDNIEVERVDYTTLTKEDLIRLLTNKDITLENYEHKLSEMEANHKKEIEDMNNFYRTRLNEHTHLIHYYERKLKILKDIITIEEGGEK